MSPQAPLYIAPRIHVLEVMGNAIVGGMETWVERMMTRLPAERFRVSVVCPFESSLTERLHTAGMGIHIIPMPEDLSWSSVNQLRMLVDLLQVDLLHAHLPNAHLLAGIVGRLTGRPVLTTIHGRQLSLTDLEIHRASSTHLSVVCRHTFLHALSVGVTPSHISCDPSGIDTQVFMPRRARATLRPSLKLPPSASIVGFVGRLSPEKGPEVLVRAALVLRKMCPDAHVVFVGDGPCREILQKQITNLGLNECVHLLGLREDMPTIYGAFDVLASTSYSEGMPLAIMEGMACGLPVVATRVGGVPDMIKHGTTGWLVSPGDFEDIARHLSGLLSDAVSRRTMGMTARKHAQTHWQIASCVARLGHLMERLSGASVPLHDVQDASESIDLESSADAPTDHFAAHQRSTLN